MMQKSFVWQSANKLTFTSKGKKKNIVIFKGSDSKPKDNSH